MIEGVYINLDRSSDRRDAMERQCEALELAYPVQRLKAVDGSALRECPAGLRPAQYGCWLSHLQALQQSAGSDAHLHIMEDDALLGPGLLALPDLLEALEAGSGGNWDVLYLDATLVEIQDMYRMFDWSEAAREKGAVQVRQVPPEFTVYGMHSYVVNGRRKRQVHDFLQRHLATQKPIDNVMAYGIQRGHLQAYLTTPHLTSGSEHSLARTVGDSGDDRFTAWLLFRRLCSWDLADEDLPQLEERLPALTRATGRRAALLGALLAYRTARWPQQRFPPGIEP